MAERFQRLEIFAPNRDNPWHNMTGAGGQGAVTRAGARHEMDYVRGTAVAVVLSLWASVPSAGPISNACMKSDRQAASAALCGCIQQVADQVLRGPDQRRAAKFFADPDRAHDTWMSQSAADDAFWDRYKAFGASATASCG